MAQQCLSPPGSSSTGPCLESLQKEAWEQKLASQAKDLVKLKKAKVCLDWHNTLEKDGVVPEVHIEHLKLLMKHADACICSYVKSRAREKSMKQDVLALEPAAPTSEETTLAGTRKL